MRLNLLGPVELLGGDGLPAQVGPGKRRAVLAVLALEANQVVEVDRILDLCWDGAPPPHARTALQGHVSALRKLLNEDLRVLTRHSGYALHAAPGAVDTVEFRELVREAAGLDPSAALDPLSRALDLWRGPALADLAGHGLRGSLAQGLQHARRDALVSLARVRLELGLGAETVAALRRAVAENPLDEPLASALMLSLHQAGAQAEALRVYDVARRTLAGQLGVDPGPSLRDAHQTVVARCDSAIRRPPPASPLSSSTPIFRTTFPAPAQLPRHAAGFTGRRTELRRLEAGLAENGLALICGPVGVGKTSLALEWAHANAHRFPDGQLFVSLRGSDPAERLTATAALGSLLQALGLSENAVPTGLEERAALYRSRLAGRRTLIVLDDAGDLEQIRPLLPGEPRARTLVTSRHRLEGLVALDGAALLGLAPLCADESAELLTRLLGRDRARAEAAALAELAELCDHLPLALRVAAARLAMRPEWKVCAVVEELATVGPAALLDHLF